jgi:predicted nucleic acid-binding protein
MPAYMVLDSFALLTFLRDEPGSEMVAAILERAGLRDQPVHMTEVSYAELQSFVRRQEDEAAWHAVADDLLAAPIEFHAADRRMADKAAELKARFKISLSDAFAAALAHEKKAELVTGQPEFKALEKEIKIKWLPHG